jgi:hypothetical protein
VDEREEVDGEVEREMVSVEHGCGCAAVMDRIQKETVKK